MVQLNLTLAYSIPVYNYLLDKIEDTIDDITIKSEIKEAAEAAKNKIKEYYPYTNGNAYIIITD